MTKSQERKLNHAIRILEIKYQVALSKPDIKYPLAWALYQTWFDEDIKSRKTEGKKYKSDMEVWKKMEGQVIMPKGTFMKIFNDQDTESDSI